MLELANLMNLGDRDTFFSFSRTAPPPPPPAPCESLPLLCSSWSLLSWYSALGPACTTVAMAPPFGAKSPARDMVVEVPYAVCGADTDAAGGGWATAGLAPELPRYCCSEDTTTSGVAVWAGMTLGMLGVGWAPRPPPPPTASQAENR